MDKFNAWFALRITMRATVNGIESNNFLVLHKKGT